MFGSTSGLNPKNQMFSWEEKSTHLKQNNNAVAADSDSDDLHQKSRVHRKQKKKFKNTHTAQLSRKNGACEDTLPVVAVHHELQIAGIQVKLPVKPYSCQIAVMNKVILGCKKKENCLLESPTGSGKTLALLCSVLAWHDHHTAEVQREISQLAAGDSDTELGEGTSNSAMKSGDGCTNRHSNIEEDGDSDYDKMFKTSERLKIPKIYYGTRTHKQIEQVIRELRKTSYRHKKMTILSSREHTCLQQSTTNKTDLCNDLLDPAKRTGCPFYNEGNKKAMATFPAAKRLGLGQVWDIEDLVTIGKEQNVCPYFAARNLMEHADIIFCPYNYIIDPDIRESMQLNLNDQVIILDEAHNIEDTCREVASVNFREDDLEAAAHDCGSLSKQRNDDPNTYNTLKEHILRLTKFIKSITLDKIDYNSNNLSSPYWTGMELLELYKMHELEESAVNTFLAACRTALNT
ncbi:PREDICTED: Fanconi anemia group J protein homolog [Dufourea novaeangliae]|uniref:Fanconi anemia group J protein homolog n=1 Tax=Dufourea novaeangliae TaxID=178035 RepID=UPI000767DB6B|nr:PREDICTED: Fanconi anemia group J protein homolog [Dufourea novaeangliae]